MRDGGGAPRVPPLRSSRRDATEHEPTADPPDVSRDVRLRHSSCPARPPAGDRTRRLNDLAARTIARASTRNTSRQSRYGRYICRYDPEQSKSSGPEGDTCHPRTRTTSHGCGPQPGLGVTRGAPSLYPVPRMCLSCMGKTWILCAGATIWSGRFTVEFVWTCAIRAPTAPIRSVAR